MHTRQFRGEHRELNTACWLEHKLRRYPRGGLDALAGRAGRLVLAAGRESGG
jgi:hypothetical protein